MNKAHDRVAVVTGGTRGIGAAISRQLAKDGALVAAVYNRDTDAAEAFAKALADDGLTMALYQANVGNPGACQDVTARVLHDHGRIDYLINNAGAVHDRTVLKMTALQWEQAIRTNLSGPFFMTQAVLPHMIERASGRIVNVSSFVGQTGRIGQANYSAAKAGLFGLTKTLALEVADQGITVNCVVPGAIMTDMVAQLPANIVDAVTQTIPVGTLGRPEDIAAAVRYLVSPEARYVTGALLPVTGGLLMM
jgi:NAD(P)-dependent dehydrogenase (short-subunit alcohol dehydrogenase family)